MCGLVVGEYVVTKEMRMMMRMKESFDCGDLLGLFLVVDWLLAPYQNYRGNDACD